MISDCLQMPGLLPVGHVDKIRRGNRRHMRHESNNATMQNIIKPVTGTASLSFIYLFIISHTTRLILGSRHTAQRQLDHIAKTCVDASIGAEDVTSIDPMARRDEPVIKVIRGRTSWSPWRQGTVRRG